MSSNRVDSSSSYMYVVVIADNTKPIDIHLNSFDARKKETVLLDIHILSMFMFLGICVQVEKLQQFKNSSIVSDRLDEEIFIL